MNFVVDIQGFTYKESYNFLPKEVAILTVHKEYLAHWIVSPPVPFSALRKVSKLSNTWLSDNLHGLEWVEDGISIHQLHSKLRRIARVASTFTVFSKDVAEYLQDIVGRSVITLANDPECPSLCKLKSQDQFCIYHGIERSQLFNCAVNNVYKIREYVLQGGRSIGDTTSKTQVSSLKKSSIVCSEENSEDYAEVYEPAIEAQYI